MSPAASSTSQTSGAEAMSPPKGSSSDKITPPSAKSRKTPHKKPARRPGWSGVKKSKPAPKARTKASAVQAPKDSTSPKGSPSPPISPLNPINTAGEARMRRTIDFYHTHCRGQLSVMRRDVKSYSLIFFIEANLAVVLERMQAYLSQAEDEILSLADVQEVIAHRFVRDMPLGQIQCVTVDISAPTKMEVKIRQRFAWLDGLQEFCLLEVEMEMLAREMQSSRWVAFPDPADGGRFRLVCKEPGGEGGKAEAGGDGVDAERGDARGNETLHEREDGDTSAEVERETETDEIGEEGFRGNNPQKREKAGARETIGGEVSTPAGNTPWHPSWEASWEASWPA